MKLNLAKVGYFIVNPVVSGKNVPMFVHAIIAELFIGPRPSGMDVNHRDGVKTNNVVSNLEYVTHQENMRHARLNGLINDRLTIPAETIARIRELRKNGVSYSKIVSETGVSIGHCWCVANNTKRIRR